MRSGRSRIVVFMFPSYRYLEAVNNVRILSGLSVTANRYGYRLIVVAFEKGQDYKTAFSSIIIERKIDGIFAIFNAPKPDAIMQKFVREQSVPFVFVNSNRMEDDLYCVGSNNTEGVRQACEHLIEKGRRRILFLGKYTTSLIAMERLSGYRMALKSAGLSYRREVKLPDMTGESEYGASTVAGLLLQKNRPDAIICYDDHVAMGALKAALKTGVKVPDELAVIGFGGIYEGAFTLPALTTVYEDGYEIGKTAMELMVSILQKQRPEKVKVKIPTTLLVRDSV